MQVRQQRTIVAAEELDGVDEAGVEGGGPAHPGRPHVPLSREPGLEPRLLQALRHEQRRRGGGGGVAQRRLVLVLQKREGAGGVVVVHRDAPYRPQQLPEVVLGKLVVMRVAGVEVLLRVVGVVEVLPTELLQVAEAAVGGHGFRRPDWVRQGELEPGAVGLRRRHP